MSTTNPTPVGSSIAWLGDLAAELTGEQISDLSEQRTELMEISPRRTST